MNVSVYDRNLMIYCYWTWLVHTATLALIEAVRTAGRKSRESHSAQDYLKLTVTQARRLQMDSMVGLSYSRVYITCIMSIVIVTLSCGSIL